MNVTQLFFRRRKKGMRSSPQTSTAAAVAQLGVENSDARISSIGIP